MSRIIYIVGGGVLTSAIAAILSDATCYSVTIGEEENYEARSFNDYIFDITKSELDYYQDLIYDLENRISQYDYISTMCNYINPIITSKLTKGLGVGGLPG